MKDTDNFEVQFVNGSYIRAIDRGYATEAACTISEPVRNASDDVRYEYTPTYWHTDPTSNMTEASAPWAEAQVLSDYVNASRIYDETDRRAIDRYESAINGFINRRQGPRTPNMTIDENGNIRFNWDMLYSDEPVHEEQQEEAQADFEDEKGGSLDDFLDSFGGD